MRTFDQEPRLRYRQARFTSQTAQPGLGFLHSGTFVVPSEFSDLFLEGFTLETTDGTEHWIPVSAIQVPTVGDALLACPGAPGHNRTIIGAFSPVDLILEDGLGRRTGVASPESATDILEEIPYSVYSGPDAEPEFIAVFGALESPSWLDAVGTKEGDYTLDFLHVEVGVVVYQTVYDGISTQGGKIDRYVVGADNSFPANTAVYEPPITNDNFALRDGTTVPIKFHLVDAEDNPIDEERGVQLDVSGPDPGGAPVTHVFEVADQTLRYDETAEPPHYVANFHTRQYPVMDGNEYTATVYEDGVPIGGIMFIVDATHGSGRGNGPPNAKESSDGAATGDANGGANGGDSQSTASPPKIGCGAFSPAIILLAFVGLRLMRPRRSRC